MMKQNVCLMLLYKLVTESQSEALIYRIFSFPPCFLHDFVYNSILLPFLFSSFFFGLSLPPFRVFNCIWWKNCKTRVNLDLVFISFQQFFFLSFNHLLPVLFYHYSFWLLFYITRYKKQHRVLFHYSLLFCLVFMYMHMYINFSSNLVLLHKFSFSYLFFFFDLYILLLFCFSALFAVAEQQK